MNSITWPLFPNMERNLEELNRFTREIVDAAYAIHTSLGPGLLESVYQTCMAYELRKRKLEFLEQVCLPIRYEKVQLNSGLRMDFWIDRTIVVELKAVDALLPVHEAQILSYMKLSRSPLGLLINFNVPLIKNGIRRFIL